MKKHAKLTPGFVKHADNTIVGSDDDDFIFGWKGDDVLIGGRGNDFVRGGKGDDYISGNQGFDILRGGKGADTFVFDGDFDSDLVLDFNAGKGDDLEFVFYKAETADWTADTLLGFCTQSGRNVTLDIPDTDESVTFRNTRLRDFDVEDFNVVHYVDDSANLLV